MFYDALHKGTGPVIRAIHTQDVRCEAVKARIVGISWLQHCYDGKVRRFVTTDKQELPEVWLQHSEVHAGLIAQILGECLHVVC